MKHEELTEVLEQHAKWLKDPKEGEQANLIWADLRGADLRGADLRWADLRGADLRWVYLRGADREGANLRETRR